MKRLFALLCMLVLSGCAVESTGLRIEHLRDEDHLRTERNLPMTFPEIQMALFKHDAACGAAPIFRMNEGQTGYATVIESNSEDLPWNQVILFDLMWLQDTWRYDTRTRVYVYSFYSDADVKRRIDAIFSAILKPGVCDWEAEQES